MKTAIELADAIDNSEETTGFERRCASMLRQQAEQIEAIEAELRRAKNDLADALDCKKGMGPTALGTVLKERDALKADAERYRWLRALPIEAPQIGLDVVMWSKDDESVNSGIGIRLAGLDAAIDAMKGKL